MPDEQDEGATGPRAAAGEEVRRALFREREAIRARDDFLSIAAHEFRTPLTRLKLELQATRRMLAEGAVVEASHVERLDRIQGHVDALGELMTALLDVTRMAAGDLQLQRGELELTALVDAVVARWQVAAGQVGTRIRVEHPERPIVGRWDGKRLGDALSAVLANAVKYGPAAPIDVRTFATDRAVEIEVADRGPGIAPEEQARIFERFARAVPVAQYGGFGVGLWTARQIVTAHGGDILLRSAPGDGSRFILRLPRAAR